MQYGNEEQQADALQDLSNESDRGAVILAASGVEDMLEATLGVRMKVLETDSAARNAMFGAQGICSTFSAKALLAYSLGIIDKPTKKKIDLVREIRNGCAHGRLPLSFKMEVLANACKAVIGEEFLASLIDHKPETIRRAFIISTANLSYSIALGRLVGFREGHELAKSGAGLPESKKP